uniref:Dead box ATP-dependent RNA helicase n=1 Tax=Rhizophora mucronata TaxID=61149 RepID=A0A2P2MMC9_RHIMU
MNLLGCFVGHGLYMGTYSNLNVRSRFLGSGQASS